MISKIKDCYQKIHEEKENKVDFSPLLYQTEDTSHDGCTKENVKGLKRGKEKKKHKITEKIMNVLRYSPYYWCAPHQVIEKYTEIKGNCCTNK